MSYAQTCHFSRLRMLQFRRFISAMCIAMTAGAHAEWVTQVPVCDLVSDSRHALAEVAGRPAIAYHAEADNRLMFVRAANAEGSEWGEPVAVAPLGKDPVLGVVNGNPAIAYFFYDEVGEYGGIRFVRALDSEGLNWGLPVWVAEGFDLSETMLTVAGNPALVCLYQHQFVHYVRADDPNGGSWGQGWDISTDSTPPVGSFAIINGHPAVTYVWTPHPPPPGPFVPPYPTYYTRANDPAGTNWSSQPVRFPGHLHGNVLCEVAGRPALAWPEVGYVKYLRASDSNGTVWDAPQQVLDYANGRVRLALLDGKPVVSYIKGAALKFIASADSNGDAWAAPMLVDPVAGEGHDLACVAGRPVISQLDPATKTLKFSWLQEDTPPPAIVDCASASVALLAPDPEADDNFGTSVSVWGGLAVVAKTRDPFRSTGAPGRAVVYEVSTGNIVSTLSPPTTSANGFGADVAIFGSLAVVGAPYAQDGGRDFGTGAAYVFNALSGAFLYALYNPSSEPYWYGQFGSSVAMWGDRIVVGAPEHMDSGQAYLFNAQDGGLIATLSNQVPINDSSYEFGRAVAITKDTVVVGSPGNFYTTLSSAQLFRSSDGEHTGPTFLFHRGFILETVACSANLVAVASSSNVNVFDSGSGSQLLGVRGGPEVVISGQSVIVGIPNEDTGLPGYVRTYDAATGVITSELSLPVPGDPDAFGIAVAATDEVIVVGASEDNLDCLWNAGSAWAFGCPKPDDADFPEHSIPPTLPRNSPMPAVVTARNRGANRWRDSDGYRLIVVSDPCGMLGAAEFPLGGMEVAPGETHPLMLTLNAPPTAGPCGLQLAMARDGVPFGETLAANINLVDAFNDARFVGHTIPPTLAPGQVIGVGASFENTGNTAWMPDSPYALGVLGADDCGLFSTLRFRPAEPVLPGTTCQFLLSLTAPSIPGSCQLNLRMIEEFVGWFGEPLSLDLNIVEPSNDVADWVGYE